MDTPEAEKAVDSKKTTRSKKAAGSKQAVRSRREIASMERKATAGALVDLGFLCYRKRTITPPIKPGKRANKWRRTHCLHLWHIWTPSFIR